MLCGNIYYFASDKARGYDQRNKYHLYLCEGGPRHGGDRVFLFISKSNSYADGFEIRKAEGYAFLPLEFSYITSSSTAPYDDDFLRNHAGRPVGALRDEDIPALISHLEASDVMEEFKIHDLCKALRELKENRGIA